MRFLITVLILCVLGGVYTHPEIWGQLLHGKKTAIAASGGTGNKTTAVAPVEMYAMTTCGICKMMASQMNAAHIPYTEYYFDNDMSRKIELVRRLKKAGVDIGQVNLAPIIFIGRHVYWGVTPMNTLQLALAEP